MSTDIRASNLSYDNEFHEKSLIVDMGRSNEGASGILMSTWLTSLPFAAAQTDGEERVNMERIFSNSTETCRNVVDAAKHFDSFNQQNFWVVGLSSNCSSEADSYTSLVDPEIISYWQDYSWPSGSGGVSCVSSARLPENEGYVLREECPPLHEGFPAPFVGDDASMSTSLQKILSSGIPACLGNPIQELMEHSRVQIEKFTVKQKSDEDFTFEGQDVMSVAGVRENPVEINFKEEMQRIDQKRKMDEDTIPSQKRYCAKQSIPSQAVHINPAGFENDENPQSSRSSRNNNLKLPSVEQTLSQDVGPAVNTNGKPRARRGSATDPQSVYARQRRERINERLKILQNLVPNGAKVDLSTMLEEAIQYVKFLQLQIKLLSSDEYWMYAPIAYNKIDAALDMRIGL